MILNMGCGSERIAGAVNIDFNLSLKPDLICNFLNPLPFRDKSIDKVYLFHVIEHIPEGQHVSLLMELKRVLKTGGIFLCSYPEFIKCAQNWINNKQGRRQFWKMTIYGRQNWPGDYHISLMYTPSFISILRSIGFDDVTHKEEPDGDFNTIVKAVNGDRSPKTLEDVYAKEWFN